MTNSLRSFGKERDIESLSNINFNSDYVERSHRFRNWLHHFTEYVNYKSGKYYWDVPYHHGSFYDFNNIELSKPIYRYHQNILNNYLWRTKKLSYDLVIFSNFITTEEVFMNFRDEIHKSVVRIRNRGLFLVVGAAGKNYPLIYDKITEFIESGNYSNYKFKASCRKIGSIDFEDSFDDVFGLKIKEISRSIIGHLD